MRKLITAFIDRQARSCEAKRRRGAMMRAIDIACEENEIWGKASRPNGLRAIQQLEQLSGHTFDPFDRVRLSLVRAAGGKVQAARRDRLARDSMIRRLARAEAEKIATAAVVPINRRRATGTSRSGAAI